ncbi:response regulator [Desulfosarcina sp.]|uniref:response regulator n=1 Tax=Desulfosarcina sp. TaxID=2027861 RepID=UPI00356485A1
MLLNRKKVMIVDPSSIFRRELKTVIQSHETLVDVIGADSISAAEDMIRNQLPSVVFLDVGFPQEQVLSLIDVINGAAGDIRLVLLTGQDSAFVQAAGLQDRADCFLPKEQAVGLRLADVIHEVIRQS